MAAPGKITREELAIVAARLGIGEAELAAAEEKHERMKTEEGLRQEFQRLRIQSWKHQLVYYAMYLAICVWPMLKDGLQSMALFFGGIVATICFFQGYGLLAPRSRKYQADFKQWQSRRNMRLPSERSDALVQRIVSNQLTVRPSISLFKLRRAVARTLECDWTRAKEAVDGYLQTYPEAKSRVIGAK